MDTSSIAGALLAIRYHLGLSQEAAAALAGVSQSAYSRAERGRLAGVTLGTLDRIAAAMGTTLTVGVQYQGGLADRLVDAAHSTLVEFVVTFFRRQGWQVELEFSFNVFGDRGSVDVLAWQAATPTLLIVEVKSRFSDLEAMLILDIPEATGRAGHRSRRARLGRLDRGTPDPRYGTAENRAIPDRHAAIFDSSFPARASEVRRWLRAPHGELAGLWLGSNGVDRRPSRSGAVVPRLRRHGVTVLRSIRRG